MKVSIGQIYVEVGVTFPFSHLMQRWLSEELSTLAVPTNKFLTRYGADWDLMVRISAHTKSLRTEVKGPSVFKKTKDVEYVLFLPYDVIKRSSDGCRAATSCILAGVQGVFANAGIDADLDTRNPAIVNRICSDPTMLTQPWPVGV